MENNVSYMPQDKYMGLPLSEKTLANRLQDVGYQTAVFGKWHLGGAPHFQPNNRGFDYFYGFLDGGHNYMPRSSDSWRRWLFTAADAQQSSGRI
ncbi:sulfatase-like hydrolase/transferase [Pseudoalteromonas sp. B193]